MGNLLVTLLNSANALGVYSRALQTVENNVVNANTPGYTKQVQTLQALPFDPASGMPGGVGAGPLASARDAFAEQCVRTQQSQFGYQKQIADGLSQVEPLFSPSAGVGISGAIDGFINSFSQLSINPNDTVARQAVIDEANQVVLAFQRTSSGLAAAATATDRDIRNALNDINRLAGQIAEVNAARRTNSLTAIDAGADATLHANLEELSQLVDINVLRQPDGSVTVYLGGQVPLVIGNRVFAIQGDFSAATARVLDSQGNDVSADIHAGKLAGLFVVRGVALPSYVQDLNTLAQGLADRVNNTLANGVDKSGNPPAANLFTYDAAAAAASLRLNNLSPSDIAAALPGAPGGNGNALALAALGSAVTLNGYTFAQFYGALGGRAGRDISTAKENESVSEQLLTQAQTIRHEISAVSLDEEATHLIAFQRSYQAVSKMLGVLNDLSGTVIEMIR